VSRFEIVWIELECLLEMAKGRQEHTTVIWVPPQNIPAIYTCNQNWRNPIMKWCC